MNMRPVPEFHLFCLALRHPQRPEDAEALRCAIVSAPDWVGVIAGAQRRRVGARVLAGLQTCGSAEVPDTGQGSGTSIGSLRDSMRARHGIRCRRAHRGRAQRAIPSGSASTASRSERIFTIGPARPNADGLRPATGEPYACPTACSFSIQSSARLDG
jgi:hypothetical protein